MSGGQRSKLLSSSTVFVSDHLRLRKNEKTCKFVRFEQVKTRQAFSDISKKLEEKSVNDFGRQFLVAARSRDSITHFVRRSVPWSVGRSVPILLRMGFSQPF